MPTLLSYNTKRLKSAIVRLLKDRENQGGRPSIKRTILQRELTKFLGIEADLGRYARDEVENKLSVAIGALRREAKPKLSPDKKDGMIRLAIKRKTKPLPCEEGVDA